MSEEQLRTALILGIVSIPLAIVLVTAHFNKILHPLKKVAEEAGKSEGTLDRSPRSSQKEPTQGE